MEYFDKERLLSRIAWGSVTATARPSGGIRREFVLRPPTAGERARSALVHEAALNSAIGESLSTEAETLEFCKSVGSWSDDAQAEISGLRKDIETITRGLLDFLFQRTKLARWKALLANARGKLVERILKRRALLADTAENFADGAQQSWIIGRIAAVDGEPVWPTEASFETSTDASLVNTLRTAWFLESRITGAAVREMARSEPWRTVWGAAKATGAQPFDGPLAEWTENQKALVHWSQLYDNVYESHERPGSEVIDDDDLLDSWILRQGEKSESRSGQGNAPNAKPGRGGKVETFVMADREGAKSVHALNTPEARAQLQANQRVLQKKGEVKEVDLPDSQRLIKEKLLAAQKEGRRRIRGK